MFSLIHDISVSTGELNDDLRKINGEWKMENYFQWKTIFNPNTTKQAQEAICSQKIKKLTNWQKHVGVTLDLKLTFEEHLLNVFEKVNRTIDLFAQTTRSIVKNNFSYYLQSLCQTPSGLWGYLIWPRF